MDKTDIELKRIERSLKKKYAEVYAEIKKELSDILDKLEYTPDLTEAKRTALLARKGRLNDMAMQLSAKINDAYIDAKTMIDSGMADVYKLNYNDTARGLGIRNGFNVIDDRAAKKLIEKNPYILYPLDNEAKKEYLTRLFDTVKGDLMTGLMRGESIPKLARRIKNTTERSMRDSVRIARTETTRAQNASKMDIGEYGKELGFRMKKKWVSTHDDRTRPEHLQMNGVVVDQDEPFVMPDGSKLMFPGDISLNAPPEQTINCRCTVIEFIDDRDFEENEQDNIDVQQKAQIHTQEEKPLTKDEADAVEHYVSGEGMWINQPLRDRGDISMEDLSEGEKELIADLDKATDRTIEPQTLYRSVDASAVFGDMSQIEYEQLREELLYGSYSGAKGAYSQNIAKSVDERLSSIDGKTILEKGFMSTSTDYSVVRDFGDFTGSDKPIVLEIQTAEGTRGLSLADKLPELNDRMEQEEVLLHRDQKYEILSVEGKDGNIYVKAKMVE